MKERKSMENWEKEFDTKEGRFSDLAYYLDKATNTGNADVPFSEIYIKDLKKFILELLANKTS